MNVSVTKSNTKVFLLQHLRITRPLFALPYTPAVFADNSVCLRYRHQTPLNHVAEMFAQRLLIARYATLPRVLCRERNLQGLLGCSFL